MPKVMIDGRPVEVAGDATVLSAAQAAGAAVPTLCFLKDVSAIGSCRVCVVEVEGVDELVCSCKTPVVEGMVVRTDTERVREARRLALDLILARHGLNTTHFCFSCLKNGDCSLQDVCRQVGIDGPTFPVEPAAPFVFDDNPFLRFDPSLCIGCQRCVGACNNQARNHALQPYKRGPRTAVFAPFGPSWRESGCESCGCCAAACPTGAIVEKRRAQYRAWEVSYVRTTCPHCATGCQYDLVVKDGRIVDTRAVDGPSNGGRLCVKGRSGSFDFVQAPDRLTAPLVRNQATGELEPTDWDTALDYVAERFQELIGQTGPESVAAFACSRSANEDIYMLQKMARCAFGTNNVDNCARVCHAPTVAGLATTLGSGAMTNTIADITDTPDVIMMVGSNIEEAHPVIGMQVRRAVEEGSRLIVVDPRDIALAEKADIHLKLRPGTNVAFANGFVRELIHAGLIDRAFIEERTEGFDAFAAMVESYTPERVGEICHIDPDDLVAAARLYGRADRAPIIYCLGVTEHSTGTEGVMSLSNIALAAGKLGRPGCGVNPIRGQNNVQGACDMGATPADLPGYQKIANNEVRAKFEEAWGVELSPDPGLMATECFGAMIDGRLRGLFIFGEDPVRTDADTNHVLRALQSLDFLVVDDLFLTETAALADVVLPGRSYAEKEGTFTNTERRVQRIRPAVEIEGTRADTWIFTEIMNRMGYAQPHLEPAAIMDEIAALTPSYSGISHERLDSAEVDGRGLQWPCPTATSPGTPIMHVGAFTRGRAWFSDAEYRASDELPDPQFPFVLMTGRVLHQYNACAMTSRTEGLQQLGDRSFIELNDKDAARLGVADGERVRVSSRRGSLETTARVSAKTSPGETWMPFHFQDGNANWLTNAALDDVCKVPEYKVCAVAVERL